MKKRKKEGYASTIYFENNNEIIKVYNSGSHLKMNVYGDPLSRLESEVNAINKLSEIKNKHIQTPEIVNINKKEKSVKQKYFKGDPFFKFLLKNCNLFYFNKSLKKIFYEFGLFLGEFHLKNKIKIKSDEIITLIHNDLSGLNMMFLNKNKLFLYDPAGKIDSNYKDLAKFICNFYFLNPVYYLFLSQNNLNKLKNSFLLGYSRKININKNLLKKHVLNNLKKEKEIETKNSFNYRLKKGIMNKINDKIYNQISNNKIKI